MRSFRLATSGVEAATQIHTHLCYSEFNVVVGAIDALNADVTSIESARSRGEILEAIDPGAFLRGIGPGVWDIHSPRVPDAEEIADQLRRARAAVGPERLWVNPDSRPEDPRLRRDRGQPAPPRPGHPRGARRGRSPSRPLTPDARRQARHGLTRHSLARHGLAQQTRPPTPAA